MGQQIWLHDLAAPVPRCYTEPKHAAGHKARMPGQRGVDDGTSVCLLGTFSALSKIQTARAEPSDLRRHGMNSAVHRAKADESPKNKLIFNSTFASPSVAAHHQRPRYCRCATSIFIASLLQGGGKAYHFFVSFGF